MKKLDKMLDLAAIILILNMMIPDLNEVYAKYPVPYFLGAEEHRDLERRLKGAEEKLGKAMAELEDRLK